MRTRGKMTLQNFSTNSSIPSNCTCFGFSQIRKISAKVRWLALSPPDVLIVMKTKLPVHIIVFVVVTSNCGWKTLHLATGFYVYQNPSHKQDALQGQFDGFKFSFPYSRPVAIPRLKSSIHTTIYS